MGFARQSSTETFTKELRSLLVGLPVQVSKSDDLQWSLKMSSEFVITTLTWRLVGAKRIIVTNEDHGHQFGLPAPVDAEVEANTALEGCSISSVHVDGKTGDLSIQVGDALTLQILSSSCGYEIWQVYRDGEFFGAVGSGGLR